MTEAVEKLLPEESAAAALPRWDLSEYYQDIHDPQVKADWAEAEQMAKAFAQKYKGKIASLSGDELAVLLEEEHEIEKLGSKPAYFANLLVSVEGNNPAVGRFAQSAAEADGNRAALTLFATLELRALGADVLRAKLKESSHLRQYSRIIESVIEDAEHALPDEVEEFLQKMEPVGMSQYIRLYVDDKLRRRYNLRGEMLDELEIKLQMNDRDPVIRSEAINEYHRVVRENVHTPVFAMNNIMKLQSIVDGARGYTTPMQSRNRSNNLEDEVVDMLIDTVKENYSKTSHRYSKLLSHATSNQILNGKVISKDVKAAAKSYTFEEAKDIVLGAYREFSPEMADIAEKFFDNGWIDAEPRTGKRGGAFMMPAISGGHPHVFLSFQGRPRDVMTLAHELGHGVHNYLENKKQNPIVSGTPLTLAETASVFGEELVFQSLMRRAGSLQEQKKLLTEKIGDELNTCVTQVAFADFERRIHTARKDGELTAEDFSKHWNDAMSERDGKPQHGNDHGWSTIPHLFRTPFYVYAYGFGQLLVNSLYNTYQEGKVEDFQQKYLDALSAGGTKHHSELLKPFGLDASKKEFWQGGLDVVSRRMDQLEKLLLREQALAEAAKDEKSAEAAAPSADIANDNEPVRITSIKVGGKERGTAQQKGQGRA